MKYQWESFIDDDPDIPADFPPRDWSLDDAVEFVIVNADNPLDPLDVTREVNGPRHAYRTYVGYGQVIAALIMLEREGRVRRYGSDRWGIAV